MLIGDFTNPPWKVTIQMEYCKYMKGYKACIKITEGQIFKFIVNGQYLISHDYETTFVGFF